MIWVGRLGAVASAGLLAMFVIGSIQNDPLPTATEAMGLACFPAGVAVGMLLGWRWPLVGAIISLVSLAAFYLWSLECVGHFPKGPYFMLFTLPAVFYMIGAVTRGNSAQVAPNP